jgi:hypothetical protein
MLRSSLAGSRVRLGGQLVGPGSRSVSARVPLDGRRLVAGKPFEEPVAFDPAFVLRHPPVAASRTDEVSEAPVMVSSVAARCPGRVAR